MEQVLQEAKEYQCNRCIYNDIIYEFIQINGIYFLLRDFKQTGIKLDYIEGRKAVIRYWFNHSEDFIREKSEKEKGYLEKRKNKVLEEFFNRADQFEEYKKTKNWKVLIPLSFSYQLIASMDDGTIEGDIVNRYEKIISEYPDFVEKAKEIKEIKDIDEQFEEFQIYFKIGIYKFHIRNIENLLDAVNNCVKDEPLAQSYNYDNTDFLQSSKQIFEEALLKNHKKEKSNKSLDEYRIYYLKILMPDCITHCYYGNEIHAFTGNNEITIDGKIIKLSKELAEWGARAYRMSIEANRTIDENKLKNLLK